MNNANASQPNISINRDIAKALAERARADLDYAAEQHADYLTKAHVIRNKGRNQPTPETAAVYYAEADKLDSKVARWDAEFKALERICVALTRAGV